MKHNVQAVAASQRLDANETIFLSRELESKDPARYMELHAGLRARRFVPPINNISPYDESYSYSMWGIQGEAKAHGKRAKDLRQVSVKRTEWTRRIVPVTASYGWSVTAIRAAAQKGIPLDDVTVIAAMSAIERKLDRLIALGDSQLGFTGLLNDAAIISGNTVTAVSNFSTAQNKYDSLVKLVSDTRARLQHAAELPSGDNIPAFDRFMILLPPSDYATCKSTPISTSDSRSILTVLEQNLGEWLAGVAEWSLLENLDSGTEGRAVCYPLNPMALGHATARNYTEEPPQADGLDINVPCHAASGGTVIRYPVAFSYMRLGA